MQIKTRQINQAASITEKRLAEVISLDPSNLAGRLDLVPLLAILQERDDFNVYSEFEVICGSAVIIFNELSNPNGGLTHTSTGSIHTISVPTNYARYTGGSTSALSYKFELTFPDS